MAATTTPISKCANTQCPNRAQDGQFVMLDIDVFVSHSRTISLLICAPCATALAKEVAK